MIVSEIKLFELLKARIGEKEAEAFVQILENKVDKKFDETKDLLATKADIYLLKEDISLLRTEAAHSKADIIKWMFLFWVGQMAAIIAVVKLWH